MIGTLCTLIARGAIISMVVVVLVIPALLVACDKLIMKTTLGTKVATEKVAAAKPTKVVKAKK